MKIILLILIALTACTTRNNEIKEFGDIQITKKQFIEKIESSCSKETNPNCILKTISFDYNQDKSGKNFFSEKGDGFAIRFENKQIKQSDFGAIDKLTSLKTYKNNTVKDSIVVYNVLNKEYAVSKKMYYLNLDLELWLLDFFIDDEGTYINFWKKYKIDLETGKINLVDNLIKEQCPEKELFIEEEDMPEQILKSYSFDINRDKIDDRIIVLKSKEEQGYTDSDLENNFRVLTIYLGVNGKQFKKGVHTINTIPLKEYGNWIDEAFDRIEQTDKGFVIKTVFAEKVNEGWLNGNVDFYFEYLENLLFLKKVIRKEEINEEIKVTTKTEKDFGIIKIEDFRYKDFY